MKSTVLAFALLCLAAAISAGRSPSPYPSTTPTATATPITTKINCQNFYPTQDTWFAPGLQLQGCVSNGAEYTAMSGRLAVFGGYINQYGLYQFPINTLSPRTLSSATLSLNGDVAAGILHDVYLTHSFNENNVSTTNKCPPPPVAISYIGTYNTTFAHLRADDAALLSTVQTVLNAGEEFPIEVGANANYTIYSIQSAFYTKEAGPGLWAQLTLCWNALKEHEIVNNEEKPTEATA